ncbi:hypothetical protein AWJ20_188 [Sugiyamaella lignohabitans]|uniref:Uncharacterized protein n=1 Tax=Sugiyamaella lignohabitans TaxID=796027 RepID=A0A167CPS5_9ASCO|nr:uncharacterized protein AWJ20_188 [Sugiyamaella lignohabitans]ANB11961.1 hypothetical protein AWJ20_188 [Sugiyamaella lignohabitans]
MSINWVTVENGSPLELPGERFQFQKFGAAIELWHPRPVPGQTATTRISSNRGTIYVSNKRVVFHPQSPHNFTVVGRGDREFRSFACDLAKMYQCQLVQPWFGANYWQADIVPTKVNGGLEPDSDLWKLKIVFKEGGVFDFTEAVSKAQAEARHLQQDGLDEALPAYSELS